MVEGNRVENVQGSGGISGFRVRIKENAWYGSGIERMGNGPGMSVALEVLVGGSLKGVNLL